MFSYKKNVYNSKRKTKTSDHLLQFHDLCNLFDDYKEKRSIVKSSAQNWNTVKKEDYKQIYNQFDVLLENQILEDECNIGFINNGKRVKSCPFFITAQRFEDKIALSLYQEDIQFLEIFLFEDKMIIEENHLEKSILYNIINNLFNLLLNNDKFRMVLE